MKKSTEPFNRSIFNNFQNIEIENKIKDKFRSFFATIPFSIDELDSLISQKKHLFDNYGVAKNSSKETTDKDRDFICKFKFDIDGGYQSYCDIKKMIINSFIENLEKAKLLPVTIYCIINQNENIFELVDIKNSLDVELKDKWWLKDKFTLEYDNNEAWSKLSGDKKYLISNVYAASKMISISKDDSVMGLGGSDQDIEYLKKHFGISLNGIHYKDCYELGSQHDDKIILVLSKPENIDEIIDNLNKIKI
jgi:hypothetical protein